MQHYRPGRVLVVNPATTLAARLCDDLHSRARARCDGRVRAFLRLSRGTDLGAGLIGRRQFDGRRFLVTAGRYGGVDRYLHALQRELERRPGATHDFHGQESKRSVHSRLPASLGWRRVVHGPVVRAAVQDEDDSWLSSLFGVAGQAGKAGQLVYQLYGFLNGGGQTTSAQLTSIQNQLDEVSAQLADIEDGIKKLNLRLDKSEYGILAGQVSGQVSAIQDAESSFDALLDAANQIGCNNYTAAGGVPATCANPQSPAQVCTTAAEAANPALRNACVEFGDLPVPAGALNFYGATGFPPSPLAAGSLVGQFISEMTSLNQFNDADIQKIASTFGGSLIQAAPSSDDGMLQAIGRIASGNPFFTAGDSQMVQDVYGYFVGVLAEGTTMRMAYYAFQGLPETTYDSAVNNMLTDLHDLYVAAPQPLPAGTFIDTNSYTMWSGQIGALESQSAYSAQVKQGSTLTLPSANANAAPQAHTPTLAGGGPISNWAAAQQKDLQGLSAHMTPGSGTFGDHLTGTDNDRPGAWPGLLSGAVWDGSAYAVGGNYAAESPQPRGFAFQQTPDEAYYSNYRLGHIQAQIPVLRAAPCSPAGNSGCEEPVWANGTASATFDANNGGDPAQVYLHGGPINQRNGQTAMQSWDNWTQDQSYCVKLHWYGSCTKHRNYSGVANHITLPALFQRTPTNTQTECYYWSADGDAVKDNGCPTGPPTQ